LKQLIKRERIILTVILGKNGVSNGKEKSQTEMGGLRHKGSPSKKQGAFLEGEEGSEGKKKEKKVVNAG